MLIFNFMPLDNLVLFKDRMLFDFDHLMHKCFDDADAHVVIVRFLFMIYRYQVQMNAD